MMYSSSRYQAATVHENYLANYMYNSKYKQMHEKSTLPKCLHVEIKIKK